MQARHCVGDVAEMPAELDRAARLASLDDRPLAVVTASAGSAAGWLAQQMSSPRFRATAFTASSPARRTRRSSTTKATRPTRAWRCATSSRPCASGGCGTPSSDTRTQTAVRRRSPRPPVADNDMPRVRAETRIVGQRQPVADPLALHRIVATADGRDARETSDVVRYNRPPEPISPRRRVQAPAGRQAARLLSSSACHQRRRGDGVRDGVQIERNRAHEAPVECPQHRFRPCCTPASAPSRSRSRKRRTTRWRARYLDSPDLRRDAPIPLQDAGKLTIISSSRRREHDFPDGTTMRLVE